MATSTIRIRCYWDSWESDDDIILSVLNYNPQSNNLNYYGYTFSPNKSFRDLDLLNEESGFKANMSYIITSRESTAAVPFLKYRENNPDIFIGSTLIVLDEIIPNSGNERTLFFSESNYIRFYKEGNNSYMIFSTSPSTTYNITSGSYVYSIPVFIPYTSGNQLRQNLMVFQLNTSITALSYSYIIRVNLSNYIVSPNYDNLYQDATQISDDSTPYDKIPTNNPDESQGNDGLYDLSSDYIPIPPAPIQGGLKHGFFSVFNPNDDQAQALANVLWDSNILDLIAKVFYEPVSTILGFGILPVKMPHSGVYYVNLGNYQTNIGMPKVVQRYIDVNCGNIDIVEIVGAFLDYSPYTRFQLFLPFVGYVPIDTDMFMKHHQEITQLGVTYRVDILNGACTAFVTANGSIYGQFGGNCLTQLPVTGSDYTRLAQALMGVATTAAGIGAQYQAYNQGMKQYQDKMSAKLESGKGSNSPTPPNPPYSTGAKALNSVFDVLSSKPNIRRGGSFAGAIGWLNAKKPHLLVTIPIPDFPEGFNSYVGRPCNKIKRLGDVKGYTVVNEINIENIYGAYESEIAEIDRILKKGVIIK